MKRIYACFAIVAALLATAFYSSFQVQRFADDISTDLDCAIEAIRTSDLPSAGRHWPAGPTGVTGCGKR